MRHDEAEADRDEIRAFWDGIEQLRGDIGAYARHSWLPEAKELLDTLAGYFQEI